MLIAYYQRRKGRGENRGRSGRRRHRELPAGSEDRVRQQTERRRIQAGLRRQACNFRVAHRLGNQQPGQGDARNNIAAQERALIARQPIGDWNELH